MLARHRDALRDMARTRSCWPRFLFFGMFGLFFCQLTYIIVIGYTNGGTGTVLQSTSIVMIMLSVCVLGRRLPHGRELAGLACAFAAIVLIATQGDLGTLHLPPLGLFWGLVSAVGATVYSMLPRPLYEKWGSFVVVGTGTIIGGLAAAVVWALAFAFPGIDAIASAGNAAGTALLPELDAKGVAALAVIAVIGTFAAFYLYLHGISVVGAVQGSQLGAVEPVSATVFAAIVANTSFSAADWTGLALMVATILLVATGGRGRAKRNGARADA